MKKFTAIVGLLACAPLWAAEGLSYNYVQLDWIANSDVEQDGRINGVNYEADGDGDGFAIEGLFSFTDMLFVKASLSDVEVDVEGTTSGGGIISGSQDGQSIEIGVGAHNNDYTGGVDVYGVLSYVDVEAGGFDENGFGIEIGARSIVMPNLEAFASYSYADIGDGDSNAFSLGGIYALTTNWGVGAEYAFGSSEFASGNSSAESDSDSFLISGRYSF